MRKEFIVVLTVFTLLATPFFCGAQDRTGHYFEIRTGVSGAPTLDRVKDFSLFKPAVVARKPLYTIESLYDEYRGESVSSPAFGLTAGVNPFSWMTVSLRGDLVNIYTPYFDPLTDVQTRTLREYVMYVMGETRFQYVQLRRFRVYSAMAAGVQFNNANHLYDRPQGSFVFQVTPVGFSLIGDSFFLFTEIGWGSVYLGVSAGLGIRL